MEHNAENLVWIKLTCDELRAGKKDRFLLRADLDQTTGKLYTLIANSKLRTE